MAGGEDSGVYYDPTSGGERPTENGKWRLIRGEGFASRVSGTVRPQDPRGGAMPIAAPPRSRINGVSDTAELSGGGGGGGGAQLVSSRVSVVLVEETNAGDTPGGGGGCPRPVLLGAPPG